MRRTLMLLAASASLFTGCKTALLPDPTVAHRLAADSEVDVWLRRPDGALTKQRVKFRAGDYCAAAGAVEP